MPITLANPPLTPFVRARYVNHLDEEDFHKRETLNILRMLRTNVNAAVSHVCCKDTDHIHSSLITLS